MSSILFNVAMVLLATQAAIQFCAQAFELYADNTAIQKIWGGQVAHCHPAVLLCMVLMTGYLLSLLHTWRCFALPVTSWHC